MAWQAATLGRNQKRMGEDVQQAGIGIRHGRALILPQLHLIHAGGQIGAADEIEPLLHFVLIFEFGLFAPCPLPRRKRSGRIRQTHPAGRSGGCYRGCGR